MRIIARDIDFVNDKLRQGQYFFTDIIKEGIALYDSSNVQLADRQELDPIEAKRIAQADFTEAFTTAKEFFISCEANFERKSYKLSAFELHQACEHSYKTVLLIFASESPQEYHLDVLGDLAADYCPELTGILPRETEAEKELFDLLDYAYIGARYDRRYKITKEQLAPCVKKLHEVIERNCEEKINSFTEKG